MENERRSIKSYRDLIVWQKALILVSAIYKISEAFPAREMYGLTSQIRRAAVSIPSNIAEGQARQHTGEFVHFLHIALGSLAEVDTQLELAVEMDFTSREQIGTCNQQIEEIRKMLHVLIRSLPDRREVSH